MRSRRASAEARTPLPQRIAAGAFVVPGACAGGVCREACAGWSCREVCAEGACRRGRRDGTSFPPKGRGALGGVPRICSAAGCGCKERPAAPPVVPDLSNKPRRNTPAARRAVGACGKERAAASAERIRAAPGARPSAPRRRRAGACRRPCRSARHAPACG